MKAYFSLSHLLGSLLLLAAHSISHAEPVVLTFSEGSATLNTAWPNDNYKVTEQINRLRARYAHVPSVEFALLGNIPTGCDSGDCAAVQLLKKRVEQISLALRNKQGEELTKAVFWNPAYGIPKNEVWFVARAGDKHDCAGQLEFSDSALPSVIEGNAAWYQAPVTAALTVTENMQFRYNTQNALDPVLVGAEWQGVTKDSTQWVAGRLRVNGSEAKIEFTETKLASIRGMADILVPVDDWNAYGAEAKDNCTYKFEK